MRSTGDSSKEILFEWQGASCVVKRNVVMRDNFLRLRITHHRSCATLRELLLRLSAISAANPITSDALTAQMHAFGQRGRKCRVVAPMAGPAKIPTPINAS